MSYNEMLTRVTLQFNDSDLRDKYQKEKVEFFSKALPVVTTALALISVIIEINYRMQVQDDKQLSVPNYVSFINWSSLFLFFIISCFHRRWAVMHILVCPLLTALTFLYVCYLDYDYTMGSIYYSIIVGFTISFFVLVIFNESWIMSTIVYSIFLSYSMK